MRMLTRLNSAYAKLPSLLESERQRYLNKNEGKNSISYYIFRTNANRIYGRNLLGQSQSISYYPQTPPTGNDTPEFYYRLAPDTLFFVFYYMEVKIIYWGKKIIRIISGNSCTIFSCKSLKTTIMAFSYETHDVVSKTRRTKNHHRRLWTSMHSFRLTTFLVWFIQNSQ